jgi:short-subunit dehydrogenase
VNVLITGASSGIGEAAARLFATSGAQVVLVSERADDLHNVANSIQEAGGKAIPVVADLSRPEQVAGLIGRVEEQAGPLDILINNAGVGIGESILEMKEEDLRFVFEVNFIALASLCRQAFARMAERKQGRIINLSSSAGRLGLPGVSAYSASKGAVHNFTRSLRIEARPYGIHVTEVLPISVRTQFFDNVKGEKYQPGGIVQTAETVAECLLRVATSPRPPAEALPYRPMRLVFAVDALFPGLLEALERLKNRAGRG